MNVQTSSGWVPSMKRAGRIWLGIAGIGFLLLVGSLVVVPPLRIFASLLVASTFVLGIAIAGTFFIAVHTLGQAGWHIALIRIFDRMGKFVPLAGIFLLISFYELSHLYHWVHEPIPEKSAWLNLPFFLVRTFMYLILWSVLAYWISRLLDKLEATGDLRYYHRLSVASGIFIVVFAITEALAAFDWIMSTEPHWYSTLFGWYVFSSYWVSCIAFVALLLLWIRENHLFPALRRDHIHDVGKYLFGFSIFWTYLFYSQYMLQWYGNIPEETEYYILRVYENAPWFYVLVLVNFFVPLFFLMRNSAKYSTIWLGLTATLVLIGHYLDFWLMIYPNIFGAHAPLGIPELGGLLLVGGTFGAFLFWQLSRLSSPALTHHPFYRESLSYHS